MSRAAQCSHMHTINNKLDYSNFSKLSADRLVPEKDLALIIILYLSPLYDPYSSIAPVQVFQVWHFQVVTVRSVAVYFQAQQQQPP